MNKYPSYKKSFKTIKSNLSKKEQFNLMHSIDNQPIHNADLIIKFKTDAERLRLANKFKKLVINPSIKLNIKFEKIQ